jgi:microcystin synthetase protein McyG
VPARPAACPPAAGAYLITGGGSGIGAEIALDLAGRGAARLALLGRAPRAERAALLARLEALGSEVVYLQADVGRPAELADALARVQRRWGRLTGVFHAAGLYDRRTYSLVNKDLAGFRAVQQPKVRGTWNLRRLLQDSPPDFVVLLASIAGVAGPLGTGLGDYAAANAFMDGCARAWDGAGGTRWLAMDWSLWDGVGMGEGSAGRDRALRALGLRPLEKRAALDALWGVLADPPASQVVVLAADAARFRPEHVLHGAPTSDHSAAALRPRSAHQSVPPAQAPHADGQRNGQRAGTIDFLGDALARLLHLERQDIDLDTSLADYGMDSLTIADLIGKLEAQYGRAINPVALLEHPTLRGLAAYLDATDGPDDGAGLPPDASPIGSTPEAPELGILRALERGEIAEQDAFAQLSALLGVAG